MIWYLRLTVSALFTALSLLVVGLWGRSFTWCDIVCVRIDKVHDQWLQSLDGELSYDGRATLIQNQFFRWIVHPAEKRRQPLPTTRPVLGFHWSLGGKPLPIVPHWFPVILFASLAVLPWLSWWRFSLRTLFISLTLAAVLLGAVVGFLNMAPPPQPQIDIPWPQLPTAETFVPLPQSGTEARDLDLFGPPPEPQPSVPFSQPDAEAEMEDLFGPAI
jgi:hypothetical protein